MPTFFLRSPQFDLTKYIWFFLLNFFADRSLQSVLHFFSIDSAIFLHSYSPSIISHFAHVRLADSLIVFFVCSNQEFQSNLVCSYGLVIKRTKTDGCCRKGPLIIIWRQSVCVCFGLVGSRPGPVTAAALYAMMGRAAAAGGDGSYSSRSARRGAGGGAAGRGESVRQRGGMGRASVPGPSMAAERGGAWRARRRSAKRQGEAGPARWKRGRPRCARVHRPHRTHPSAPPLMFVSAVRDRRPPSSPGGLTAGRGQARWPDGPSGGVAGGPGMVSRAAAG